MGGEVGLVLAGSAGKGSQKRRGRESRTLASGGGAPLRRPWGWDVVRACAQPGRVFVAETKEVRCERACRERWGEPGS